MSTRSSKGATKRFQRRLFLSFLIVLIMLAGALIIAYCKGSDRGAALYEAEMQEALLSAYEQGYADAKAEASTDLLTVIESAEIDSFSLEGEDFIVTLSFNGELHDYHVSSGNVVDALPFQ